MAKFYLARGHKEDDSGNDITQFKDIKSGFTGFTSTHGIPHIARSFGVLKQVMWLLCTLICLGGFIYNFYVITATYVSRPVYTVTAIQSHRQINFPAVSICNANPVKKSAVSQSPELEDLLTSWSDDSSRKKSRRKRASSQCPNPSLDGTCYWDYCSTNGCGNTKVTQADAVEYCQSMGSTLAVLDTQEKWEHVQLILSSNKPSHSNWMDLTYNTSASAWLWNDTHLASWSKWENDPPDPNDGHCACVTQNGWINEMCDEEKCDIICQDDRDSLCSKPLLDDWCYWNYCENQNCTQTSYAESLAACTGEGGSLAVIDKNKIQKHIEDVFYLETYSDKKYWMDLVYNTSVNDWIWGTGSVVTWDTWDPDPSANPENMSCACTSFDKWTNEECNISMAFEGCFILCQKYLGIDIATTATAVPETVPETMPESTTTQTVSTTTYFSAFEEREPPREDFQKESDFIGVLADISVEEKRAMGYSFNEFFLQCFYNRKECDHRDFNTFYDAIHGNCYVFNAAWNDTQDIKVTSDTGRSKGLQLYLNIGQHEYIEAVSEGAGVVVLVHIQDQMPFPSDEGILAPPGHISSFGVRQLQVDRLGNPYSDCLYEDEQPDDSNMFNDLYPVGYSLSVCEKTCYQRSVIATCGCADPQYPTNSQALGDVTVSSCDARNQTQDDCVYGVTLKHIENELDCDCKRSCSSQYFDYTVSKNLWPSIKEKDTILERYYDQISGMLNASSDEDYFENNLLKLEIYYESLESDLLRETPKYLFGRYISDVGSIIGLWLGCSLFSIMEFLELGLDTLVLSVKRGYSKKKSSVSASMNVLLTGNGKRRVSPDVSVRSITDLSSTESFALDSNSRPSRPRSRMNRRIVHRRIVHSNSSNSLALSEDFTPNVKQQSSLFSWSENSFTVSERFSETSMTKAEI